MGPPPTEKQLSASGGSSSPSLPIVRSAAPVNNATENTTRGLVVVDEHNVMHQSGVTSSIPAMQEARLLKKKEDESIVGILNLRASGASHGTRKVFVPVSEDISGSAKVSTGDAVASLSRNAGVGVENGVIAGVEEGLRPAAADDRLCHVCNKDFRDRSSLRTHMRSHTGERPYKCDICGKGFTQCGDVKIHKRTHTGEKPYQCNYPGCQQRFTQNSSMRQHAKLHTGLRLFVCTHEGCGKKFSRKFTFTQHSLVHSGVKPFECAVENCRKRFVRSSGAKKHYLSSHKELVPHNLQKIPPAIMYRRIWPDSADALVPIEPKYKAPSLTPHKIAEAPAGTTEATPKAEPTIVAAARMLENEGVSGDGLVVDDITAEITSSGNAPL